MLHKFFFLFFIFSNNGQISFQIGGDNNFFSLVMNALVLIITFCAKVFIDETVFRVSDVTHESLGFFFKE